jgi:hypothetical protein
VCSQSFTASVTAPDTSQPEPGWPAISDLAGEFIRVFERFTGNLEGLTSKMYQSGAFTPKI